LATYNKFHNFAEEFGKKLYDMQAAGDVLKIYLTNTTPNPATMNVKADLAEITPANGYPAGGSDIQNSWSESSGTATLAGVDVAWTASGGNFGPFRYVVLYNDTPTSPADPLIAWWEYPGGSITVFDTEVFTVDFGASVFTLA
jgi:hypothetical protein